MTGEDADINSTLDDNKTQIKQNAEFKYKS